MRNKIRRRLREVIRAHQDRIVEGCHLVLIARWKSPDADLAELEKDWLRLAKRAEILKTPTHP
jgi:ribonuclease P protein component